LELPFVKLLDHERPVLALHKELADNPELFAEVIRWSFKPASEENEVEPDLPEEALRNRAEIGWELLHRMATCPGEAPDGTIDGKGLIAWIDQAKGHLSANDRLGIGLDRIGDVLGRTKAGDDGIWPCEPVRDAIEHVSDDRLSTSVRTSRSNARGV